MIRQLLLVLALFAAPGCGAGVGLVLLGAAQADDLVENFEAGFEAQQHMLEYVLLVGRGEIDVTSIPGATYDAPTELNGWVGTLFVPNGAFSFGTGDLSITFTATGDAGPVDPQITDLSTHTNIGLDAFFTFAGISNSGRGLSATGDFDVDSVRNALDDLEATVDGAFNVRHDGYDIDLIANEIDVALDIGLGELESLTGRLDGRVDIPNFAFDADFDLDGLGDRINVAIDAAATTIDYTLDLF